MVKEQAVADIWKEFAKEDQVTRGQLDSAVNAP